MRTGTKIIAKAGMVIIALLLYIDPWPLKQGKRHE